MEKSRTSSPDVVCSQRKEAFPIKQHAACHPSEHTQFKPIKSKKTSQPSTEPQLQLGSTCAICIIVCTVQSLPTPAHNADTHTHACMQTHTSSTPPLPTHTNTKLLCVSQHLPSFLFILHVHYRNRQQPPTSERTNSFQCLNTGDSHGGRGKGWTRDSRYRRSG